MYGIRYIDIRVGFYRKNNEFWANHGIAKQHLLVEILRQIKEFAIRTNEIIIIDFQEFPVGKSSMLSQISYNSLAISFSRFQTLRNPRNASQVDTRNYWRTDG
jgi:hypothetical protein